mgnify:CR=1 FL=1
MIKIFPKDCQGCENLISYDMSIDDITNICKINGLQIDDCDRDFQYSNCPLGREKPNPEPKSFTFDFWDTWY